MHGCALADVHVPNPCQEECSLKQDGIVFIQDIFCGKGYLEEELCTDGTLVVLRLACLWENVFFSLDEEVRWQLTALDVGCRIPPSGKFEAQFWCTNLLYRVTEGSKML